MTEGVQPPYSEIFTFEPVTITPTSLWKDNESQEAIQGLTGWEMSRRYGNLTGVRKCPDSRTETPLPRSSATIGSIATGGDFDSYKRLFNFQAFRDFIALGHYDGSTLTVGKMPTGCGGLAARAKIDNGIRLDLRDVQAYVERGIAHPDVVVQTFLSASEITKRTGKDVLAAAQDHLDGTIVPFALFSGKNSQYRSSINPELLLHRYNPGEIYRMGFIPPLADSDLPPHFQHILREYQQQQARTIGDNPRLPQYQKVQNPVMVYFSTDIRPVQLKFPQLAGRPNRIFELNVPRTKINNGIHIDGAALDNVIDQTEYPMTHAVENKDNPRGEFSRTKTLYVETGDFDQSIAIAEKMLSQRPWMQEWRNLLGSEIIVAQTKAGRIEMIQRYQPGI